MKFSTKIQTLEDGVKSVSIRDDDSKPLLVTLKGVKVVSTSEDEVVVVTGDTRLKTLEDEVLEKAKSNKVAWFGKELNDSKIEGAFIRSHTEESSELSMKRSDSMRIYDTKRKLVEDKGLDVDDTLDVVVQLASVDFLRKSFDTVWVIHQAKYVSAPKPKKVKIDFSECMFEEDSGEQTEEEEEFF